MEMNGCLEAEKNAFKHLKNDGMFLKTASINEKHMCGKWAQACVFYAKARVCPFPEKESGFGRQDKFAYGRSSPLCPLRRPTAARSCPCDVAVCPSHPQLANILTVPFTHLPHSNPNTHMHTHTHALPFTLSLACTWHTQGHAGTLIWA